MPDPTPQVPRATGKTGAASAPVVSFDKVGKVYDDDDCLRVTALDDVSFDVPPRRFAMIVGPSGSGKTTLLPANRAARLKVVDALRHV